MWCIRIVRGLNGEIDVESSPGKGTGFIIKLPRNLDKNVSGTWIRLTVRIRAEAGTQERGDPVSRRWRIIKFYCGKDACHDHDMIEKIWEKKQ